MKKLLMLTVAASLVLAAPLQAASTKPKKPPSNEPTIEQVRAGCKKQYGNGSNMRVAKKNGKWWCYWSG
jgi:hypothetical protein